MTPDALTKLFYQEKMLQRGRVLEVHITENAAFNSQIQHLKVSYSTDAVPPLPTEEEHFRAYCQRLDQNWQSCLAAEGHWLPQDVVSDISEILRLLPVAWERYLARRFPTRLQITLLHEDAYLVNFLVPRTEADGNVYMLDWQSAFGGMGMLDLVIMCASFWTSAQRQENKREETMLRRYLAALQAHGVTNYTWDQLMEDYRLMIMFFLQVAIWDQTNDSERDYWWPKLQCLLSAARDLDCVSLLR